MTTRTRPEAVPAELGFSTAKQLASAIRARELSAVDVVDAHLAQIDKLNKSLNAVVTLDAEGARRRASEADKALAKGEVLGPLHGVPFVLKDAFATAGMRTTTGFAPLDHVPNEDSTVAFRLKSAGAILLGKSNVATLLADFQTSNPIFGRTNNPWDVERTPGGSSGGAAAAVAAGMTPFDVGTDLSGSTRLPAHFCGVFGLKPTEHRVSLGGVAPDPHGSPRPVRIMSCVGPIARSVDDIVLLYQILAGPDWRDTDVPPVPVESLPLPELNQLRIAVAPTLGGFPVAADVREAVENLAKQLDSLGAIVEEAVLPQVNFERDLENLGALIGMATGAFQQDKEQAPTILAQYLAALHMRDRSIVAWEQFFDKFDILLCPPAMTTAFPHCEPGSQLRVDGKSVSYWTISAHAALFNYSGNPALVLPYDVDSEGLPVGVQLVAKRWSDDRLLAIGRALSQVTREFQRPPIA
ncbi:MAG TPA: amidase [Gemmatimonadaceae bacterium]|nr:amidase [Gemmatimonadaceae bacterium]